MVKYIVLTSISIILLSYIGFTLRAQNFSSNEKIENMKSANSDAIVEIKTSFGPIQILLYGDTPKHRDNFLALVDSGVYDGVLFHRVINDFMIQTGDPDSKEAESGKLLGEGQAGYDIDAEIVFPKHFHKRGALAAARQGDQVNPLRKSSGSQFYIVTGKVFNDDILDKMEIQHLNSAKQRIFTSLAMRNKDMIQKMQIENDTVGLKSLQNALINQTEDIAAKMNIKYTPDMREVYKSVGGTPHLDNEYTVFGEVISGMDVVDKIQKVATDPNDRPLEDVRIIRAHRIK